MRTTATETRALAILDATRPYQTPLDPEEIRKQVLTYLLRDITPDILGTCTHIALIVFDRPTNVPFEFDETNPQHVSIYEQLVAVKTAIEGDLEEKMKTYRAQVKKMSQAYTRLYQLQAPETPNAKAVAAAFIVATEENNKLAEPKAALLDAQRAESYFRCIPSVYKSQNVADALDALSLYLRTNAWNPKVRNEEHANTEKFLRKLFNK